MKTSKTYAPGNYQISDLTKSLIVIVFNAQMDSFDASLVYFEELYGE